MNSTIVKTIGSVFLIISLVVPGFFVFGQTAAEERAQLELELQNLESEIDAIEGDITKTQQEKKTFESHISILKNKIKKLDLEIQKSSRLVQDLKSQIVDTQESIVKTVDDVDAKKEQLAEILRNIAQEDAKTFPEVVLSGPTLSEFFSNVISLEVLHQKNKDLLKSLTELQSYLAVQKGNLESEKVEEEHYQKIQVLQKRESQSNKTQTEKLLSVTKGKESEYQKLLTDRKKKAQEIRTRIFELIGVSHAPTFGEALEIANSVSVQTGVRPALLLAVLTQESSLGKNVGQCYLTNTQTGAGVRTNGASVQNVMKPTRDVQPFIQITQELGKDFTNTAVSCPIPSVGGYGGAMGPAQFIPSTWIRYRDKLASLLGRPGDPWNIRDAFSAAALYLSDYGATAQTYNAEWKAAMIYFSGSTNTRYRFYGDSVMRIAAGYEEDIKALAS
ncbi:MAG: lytic murein transglycosylase, partial [Candidatus Wildermuthbacteria bacterium]|nr:lytic murein transglycosylase [Candidatus Wildermuthbacteria bacterium]